VHVDAWMFFLEPADRLDEVDARRYH
jgi:hypothetical protein